MHTHRVSATKANLLATKKSLELARLGYDLMDRKRNVLVREMMLLVDKVKFLRSEITDTYENAYLALQQANMSLGVIAQIANAVEIDDGISVVYRSVMGVEIPVLELKERELKFEYGFDESNSKLDEAYIKLVKAKNMTIVLAEIDNSVFRLARAIQKTQKRANALKNIVIPQLENDAKYIITSLEEKEREEFTRLKLLKNKSRKEITQS